MKRILRSKAVTMLCSMLFCTLFVSVCKAEEYENIDSDEVIIKATDLEIDGYEEELMIGETMSLTATVVPSNATDTVVTFKSSDTDIATVKSSGTITGKKAGNVTIYVTCGDITKELPIIVKVKTKAIEVNSQYVVMQSGEEFQVCAKVIPDSADSNFTYKSLDENIAVVSANGIIKGGKCGTTSILVSNGYAQSSITVVVNKTVMEDDVETNVVEAVKNAESFPEVVYANELEVINTDMLQYYYENNKDFSIKGDKYTIYVDSEDIVNCENQLRTVIEFETTSDGIAFYIEDRLCGKMTLDISDMITEHKYLFLYNNDKGKYQRLNVENVKDITIDTAGKYIISFNDLSDKTVNIIYILGGIAIIVIGIMVYVFLKKKYWFW